ncbi:hypothetical protein ACXXDK_09470 [Deinococcus sp. PESE-38]
MKRVLAALLGALLLPSAHAQLGQPTDALLKSPLFVGAQTSRAGIITLKSGVNVVLGQRGGLLTNVTITTPYTEPQGISGSNDTAVAAGSTEQRVGGSARAAQTVGAITGYGESLSAPLLQFLRQPDVVKQLPQGVTVDAPPDHSGAGAGPGADPQALHDPGARRAVHGDQERAPGRQARQGRGAARLQRFSVPLLPEART